MEIALTSQSVLFNAAQLASYFTLMRNHLKTAAAITEKSCRIWWPLRLHGKE